MNGLTGKVIVVAAGGTTPGRPAIGAATARRLGREGARVVVGDLDGASAEATAEAIRGDGGDAVAVSFDASSDESVRSLIDAAVAEYGRLDGVHSNAMDMSAATIGVDSEHDICTLPIDVWQRSIDVGLTGFFLVHCGHRVRRDLRGRARSSRIRDGENRHDCHRAPHRLSLRSARSSSQPCCPRPRSGRRNRCRATRRTPGEAAEGWTNESPRRVRRHRKRRGIPALRRRIVDQRPDLAS
jgi:hypothetical protein